MRTNVYRKYLIYTDTCTRVFIHVYLAAATFNESSSLSHQEFFIKIKQSFGDNHRLCFASQFPCKEGDELVSAACVRMYSNDRGLPSAKLSFREFIFFACKSAIYNL